MTLIRAWASAAIVFLLASSPLGQTSVQPIGIGAPAPEFALEDAFGRRYASADMRGSFVSLIFGARRHAEAKRRWAQSVLDALPGRSDVRVLMVADMRNVPFFVTRDFVKGRIQKEKLPVPLLLDWDQAVHQAYGIQSEDIEIVVTNPEGRIQLRRKMEGFAAVEAGAFLKEFISAAGQGPAKGGAKP